MPDRPSFVLVGFLPENRVVPEIIREKLSQALSEVTQSVTAAGCD